VAIADAVDEIHVELLHPAARVPERAREGDAGYDLRTLDGFVLAPGARRTVSTGVALALPPQLAGLVLPRSGLAAGHGVTTLNSPGLIDPSYRGEIKVVLHNAGAEPYEARVGDRIAQLLLIGFCWPSLRPVEALPPGPGDRGANGFGSSGR
jgi:dUTP pyrophosphatase